MIRSYAAFLFRIGILVGMLAPFLAAQTTGSRSVLRAREFITNPSLMAHARQTVVLDYEPSPFEEPVIRYELEEGPHDFCLSGKQTDFTGMVLKDMFGDKVFQIPGYERCTRVELPGGIYELRLLHSGKHQPDSNRDIRVQVDPPSPPLVDSNGNPVSGWWAVQPDPALDPLHRAGRLRAQPPFRDLINDGNGIDYGPVIADFSSQVMDEYSLFHILHGGNKDYEPAILQAKETYWSVEPTDNSGHSFVIIGYGCNFDTCQPSYAATKIKDLGNNKFQLSYDNSSYSVPYMFADSVWAHSELAVSYVSDPPATLRVVFRFFPDSTQIANLYQGEAALFQACSYNGKAAVFAYGAADLSAVTSPVTTIDNSAKSIVLGNNTAVFWRSASSQPMAITVDTTCLPAGSAAPSGKDFEVLPLDTLLSDASDAAALDKKCINCKLRGVTLANLDLDGWNLSGADLSGATLANVKLNKAKLDGAILAGTKLPCVDFSGVDQNHPADLTSVDFSKVQWVETNGCKTNFKYTLLSVTKLPPPSWKYVDLSYATFVDAKGQQLSNEGHPLDLNGVTLAGISLQGAILDYATGLAGADLTRAVLSGASLRHVNLSGGAKLNGAHLNNANLEGANLSAADLTKSGDAPAANLQGAFLKNVNLSKAQLDGADFTNASFYGTTAVGTGTCIPDKTTGFTNACATAAGATINNTQFSDAYLFGVDFTGAKIQGVQFANAVLAGANFAGASLSVDTSVGTNSGFSGAFLQGTNLAPAKSLAGISLAGAFVDFSPQGNTLYLKLGGQHTVFAGYWNAPGQVVCAEMSYTGAPNAQQPLVPTTNETIICPDGNTYPEGCGPANTDGSNQHWKSPVDITQQASYQFDSTYTKAPPSGNPICAFDSRWSGAETSRPREPRRPHPSRPEPGPR
jgi:uncharacterized protein YjbI with pentapeptide repeats